MAKSGRKTGRVIIIVAVVLIIILLGAVYAYIQLQPLLQPAVTTEEQPAQIQLEEMVNIVITTQFIPRGEVITQGVLAEIPFPKKELVEGTFITDMDNVIGKKAIYPLEPRMPITPSILLDPVTGGSVAAFDVPVDKTALSIPIDREALIAYAPQAGDHVMVIGCMNLVDVDPEYQSILPN
jgi:Flp pilus assembly protein CpaB